MKRRVIGSLAAAALFASMQARALDREATLDALVNAVIYAKLCDGKISANTQRILNGYAQLFRMDADVGKKVVFADDFTKKYPDQKAALCSDAKQAVLELESKYNK